MPGFFLPVGDISSRDLGSGYKLTNNSDMKSSSYTDVREQESYADVGESYVKSVRFDSPIDKDVLYGSSRDSYRMAT